ncbi:MAG: hypothetical protein RLN70_12935 [Rhodospirillaceae bacterium]
MMRRYSTKLGRTLAASSALVALMATGGIGSAAAQEGAGVSPVQDGRIGYVMTNKYWAVYQTPNAEQECPNGFNDGPREQFKLLYPEDGTQRTLIETHLEREAEIWHPSTSEEPYPFKEAQGPIAMGLDLDGKVDPTDFRSPDGDEGIDPEVSRVIGWVANYRGPDGTIYHFENKYVQENRFDRQMIELTGVDSLVNDDDVTVTTYRGLDTLLTDATGKDFIPGGTQRADHRFGKRFSQSFKGKIVDGVLTTEPADLIIPWSATFDTNTNQPVKALRFKLKLTPEGAEGIMAGYAPIDGWYYRLTKAWSTHHQSYGQLSSPSVYRALRRLADAYPDPETGENTAISGALDVKFTQVFIIHPDDEPAVAQDGERQRNVAAAD